MELNSFEKEQQIYNSAISRIKAVRGGAEFDFEEFAALTANYGSLLGLLRKTRVLSERSIEDLLTSNLDLLDKIHYDVLTGIYNRRYMEETLRRFVRSMSRSKCAMSVMMIDIDFFKKYNDTYGHGEGDACLKAVAQALAQSVSRAEDFVARYGGEEFVVVLPNTGVEGVHITANKLLESIRALGIPHEDSSVANCITISIGATTIKTVEHMHSYMKYIECADEALYASKQTGRNRYTFIEFKG